MNYDLKQEKDTDKIDKNREDFYTVSSAEKYNKKIKSVLDSMKRGSLEPEETSEYELCFQAVTKFKLLRIEPHKGNDGPKFDIYLETTGEIDRPI